MPTLIKVDETTKINEYLLFIDMTLAHQLGKASFIMWS